MSLDLPDVGPVPDAIEPLPAYRAWRVAEAPLRLESASMSGAASAWLPGVPAEARCLRNDFARLFGDAPSAQPHTAPEEGCRCGLYGMKTLDLLLGIPAPVRGAVGGRPGEGARGPLGRGRPGLVLGRIEVWGKVIVATKGYRAQLARVTELYVAPGQERLVAELADIYEVEVRDELMRLLAR